MQPDWYSAGVSGGGRLQIPAGETEAEFVFSASSSAAPGTYRMSMNGHTMEGDWESGVGVRRVSSDFFELKVTSPYVSVRFPSATIRRNQTAEIECEIKHLQPFEGAAQVKLLGLPKGVTLEGDQYQINSESKSIVFRLKASDEALLGQYRELKCQFTYQAKGQSIRQVSSNGTLRVDPAVAKEK